MYIYICIYIYIIHVCNIRYVQYHIMTYHKMTNMGGLAWPDFADLDFRVG